MFLSPAAVAAMKPDVLHKQRFAESLKVYMARNADDDGDVCIAADSITSAKRFLKSEFGLGAPRPRLATRNELEMIALRGLVSIGAYCVDRRTKDPLK